ncbi:PQQ-binding-like beta-propeller repeat protein [Microvirga sp. M2]|uniref:outer membrane protein assembly factor BamB family protein n=1 Tax=Microvirga sp. M2 TaxID=3073270 RepID=UPI0039C35D00
MPNACGIRAQAGRWGATIARLGVIAGLAIAAHPGSAAAQNAAADWPNAGQNPHDTRNAPNERGIGPSNVGKLATRWVLATKGNVTTTPAVIEGTVYVPDYGGMLWAIDASDGKVRWSNEISLYSGIAGDVSRTTPAYWEGTLITGQGVQTAHNRTGAFMLGIDARTGQPLWRTKVEEDPEAIITSSPVVDEGVVYVGTSSRDEAYQVPITFRGSVVALDAKTGKLLWKTYMVPQGYTGGAVWSSTPVVDHDTGLLYVTTGNNYTVPTGVCRAPERENCTPGAADNRIDSIVALDLKTGQITWSTPTLTGDLSTNFDKEDGPDYDFAAGPNLYTAISDGQPRTLLGAGQKSGIYWALDPQTGKVLWKTEVGPGSRKGGMMWGTAADGRRIYVSIGNGDHLPVSVTGEDGSQATTKGGLWAAIDAATGKVVWRTADPQQAIDTCAMSVANGVVYAGSMAGSGDNMYALDADTGAVLWKFASGGAVASGASIVNGTVYWGSGYQTKVIGLPYDGDNNKFYAFSVEGR